MTTDFVVRITIHEGSEKDYETLHDQMARLGFNRTILGADGNHYQLPDATYVGISHLSTPQLRDVVASTAHMAVPKSQLPDVLVLMWVEGSFLLNKVPTPMPLRRGLAA